MHDPRGDEPEDAGRRPPNGAAPNRGEQMFGDNLPDIEQAIRAVCRRYRLTADVSEDFASYARLKLMTDGYAILNKFRGQSSLKTFLYTTIGRLYLDYRIAEWGKWRPSAEAVRLGPLAERLEELVVRDSHPLDAAYEILTTNHGFAVSRAEIEAMAARLPPRHKRRPVDDAVLDTIPAVESADGPLIEAERTDRVAEILTALREERARLPPRDQLLLSLRHDEGLKMPAVAAIMKIDAKVLYRDEERIKKGLRERLIARGFNPEGLFE